MRTKRTLLLIYFKANPVELKILQDKSYGFTEKALAKKYKTDRYSIHKIRRLRIKLNRLFGRRSWNELIFEAQELGLIKKVPQLKIMLSDKPNDFLISTIDQMEDRESDKIYEQQQKEWKKKKKALKWE
jgi:hypothetical protein